MMARWLRLAPVLATLGGGAIASGAEPRVPDGWRFVLPAGKAAAGEQVFVKMEKGGATF